MKAISSMATRQLLSDLVAAAEAAGLPAVDLESVGGVDAARRVATRERFDLVFLASDALRLLATHGHVDAASITPLVRSQVAVAVASGTDERAPRVEGAAFADSAGLRAALLESHHIGYSTGPSGAAFLRMIDGWRMRSRLEGRLVRARPGVPVARLLANGEVDLGLQQVSELVGQVGVRVLGVLPDDCAIDTVFSGAVASTADDPLGASAVLTFAASGAVIALKAQHGFTTP